MEAVGYGGEVLTERLLAWCDQAQRAGRKCRAEYLLLLAWRAYERPLKPVQVAV